MLDLLPAQSFWPLLCLSSASMKKAAIALGTNVRSLASVKLDILFHVMSRSKLGFANITLVGFLLALGEEMTLQVMMPAENRTAVWAFLSLGRRRPGVSFVVGTALRLR